MFLVFSARKATFVIFNENTLLVVTIPTSIAIYKYIASQSLKLVIHVIA